MSKQKCFMSNPLKFIKPSQIQTIFLNFHNLPIQMKQRALKKCNRLKGGHLTTEQIASGHSRHVSMWASGHAG